jgi:DNA-binding transcriptional regulator YiaG
MAEISSIVERLGGAKMLAARLNVSRKAIEMWERRGVPRSRQIELLLLAKERGVDLTIDELLLTQSQRAA